MYELKLDFDIFICHNFETYYLISFLFALKQGLVSHCWRKPTLVILPGVIPILLLLMLLITISVATCLIYIYSDQH